MVSMKTKYLFLFFLFLGILTIAACGRVDQSQTSDDQEETSSQESSSEDPTEIFDEDDSEITDIEDVDVPIEESDLE